MPCAHLQEISWLEPVDVVQAWIQQVLVAHNESVVGAANLVGMGVNILVALCEWPCRVEMGISSSSNLWQIAWCTTGPSLPS